MDKEKYIIFCTRGCRPIDKFDVFIARVCLGALYFTLFLFVAFVVLLLMII